MDTFAQIEKAAHSGALGVNGIPEPTQAEKIANDYKVGKITLLGLPIAIEQPRDSVRSGVNEKTGIAWSNRMAAHYGYFDNGVTGADGDEIDVFVCSNPESKLAYVINQVHPDTGSFDEHKVMLFAQDEAEARSCYTMSYDADWKGLGSIVPATINQLKWWMKNGDTTIALIPTALPEEGYKDMKPVAWNGEEPVGVTFDSLLYDMRRHDDDKLLFDAATLAEVIDDSDGAEVFDALVTPFSKLQRNMERMQSLMTRVTDAVKPVAMQISDPFKQRGVANIAVLYELSDGQTITIYFHNPDATPKRILPTDELVSWKWLLNKKDITIVAAPERGQELSIREVARRTMRLAAKNSAAFQRFNGKRADRLQSISALKTEVEAKELELKRLQHEIEVKHQEKEDAYIVTQAATRAEKAAAAVAAATAPSVAVAENKPPEAVQDDIVEHYENRSEGIESIVVSVDGGYVVRVINSENGDVSTIKARFIDLEAAKYAAQEQAGLIKKAVQAAPEPAVVAELAVAPLISDPIAAAAADELVNFADFMAANPGLTEFRAERAWRRSVSDAMDVGTPIPDAVMKEFSDRFPGMLPDNLASDATLLDRYKANITGALKGQISRQVDAHARMVKTLNYKRNRVGDKEKALMAELTVRHEKIQALQDELHNRESRDEIDGEFAMTMLPLIRAKKAVEGAAEEVIAPDDATDISADPIAATEQTGQTGADAGATAQLVEDDLFIQSVIDGVVDIFDAALPNRLQEIVGRISSDQDRMVKWNLAVSAFSASMMTAAVSRLAA